MKTLTLAGSLRKDSFNKKIAQYAANLLQDKKLSEEVTYCDLQPLEIPVYDGDVEGKSGLPLGVVRLIEHITQADALVISTPEYNGSIPGVLKNVLDWISRHKPNPLAGKHVLLLAASPGALGGIRALWHTRVPFEALGCHVYPEMVGLGKVNELLTSDGKISDQKMADHIEKVLTNFVNHVKG